MIDRTLRGLARVESLAAVACVGLLLVLAGAVLGSSQEGRSRGGRLHPRSMRDSEQLITIHRMMVIFSREMAGVFPTPGLIDRLPVELDGQLRDIPGRGPEDITQNTTANLYSMLIMRHYIPEQILVSPIERNPKVSVCKDYDYARYSPLEQDEYWDPSFQADLETGSNTSYAHLVMFGKRRELQWRDTLDPSFPVLGNRGPKDGSLNPSSNTCGPHGHWTGNVVFNDNHAEMLATVRPVNVTFMTNDEKQQDNIFAFDNGVAGMDTILTFTKQMTEDGPVLQHD